MLEANVSRIMMDALSLGNWFLFSLGLWKVLGKLHWNKRWMAWIPGLRYITLSAALDTLRDGIVAGVLEVVFFILEILTQIYRSDERAAQILSVAFLILLIFLYIYRIRIFLRLAAVFGRSKAWVLLWIVTEWLTLMIFGYGKKFQPLEEFTFTEEWEAGTQPAQIDGLNGDARKRSAPREGLSVDLRERTVRDLGKKRYLLKDIDLDIPNGSLVLLLGGSGSGKTTLVNAIIGYEKADAKVYLNGADVYEDYEHIKYRIGFVPQQHLIRGNDSVIRTVSDAAELRLPSGMRRRERKDKVSGVMDLLGLAAGADGLVSKKSGGQLRRISIAMELVSDPELFVLDEPDSGLDGVIAREIFLKLRGIADEGKIVIVITHTPDRVIDLFDKVIVLARDSGRVGRLAFYGTPREAREFFGKDTMEGVVMSVNRREEGGDGLADECIERYARLMEEREEGAVV